MCVVLSGCYLARFKLIRISVTLLDMSDTCLLQFFRRIVASLCLYENYDDDVTTW
jgi:hypothetical protein